MNRPMAETSSRDLFPGALEMMILESLRRQPAHGYALVQHIQQRSNNLLQVEEGSLYPALQRLLKDGLLSAGVEDPEIFLLQAADEFATLVEDRSVELHDFSGDLQWMFRGRSRRLLSPSRGVSCVQTGAGEK